LLNSPTDNRGFYGRVLFHLELLVMVRNHPRITSEKFLIITELGVV